jgi:prephenate dehydrogenase
MLKTLQQIDQELIQLLNQRSSLLSGSSDAIPVEMAELMAQEGLPEFVWESLVTCCEAVAATAPPRATVSRKEITIIGGAGQIGRFFTKQLVSAGHHVRQMGRHDWSNAKAYLATADLVIISVPMQQTVAVIQQAAPYLSATAAIADVNSIKGPVVEAMLAHHRGPVLGMHPMFGPGLSSFLAQNVVICPGRNLEAFQWLLDLMSDQGGNLLTCTPEEHDQMMVTVQAIRHFSSFGLGVFLAQEGIDLDRSLDFSSAPYRLQLNLVSRLFAQDAALPVDLMVSSEDHRQAILALAETYSRLAQLVQQEDQATLEKEFESTSQVFQTQVPHALQESQHIIQSLSVRLAANTTNRAGGPYEQQNLSNGCNRQCRSRSGALTLPG